MDGEGQTLSIAVESSGAGEGRITLSGPLDLCQSPALLVAIDKARRAGGRAPTISLDAAGVTYLDTAGIATLVVALRSLRATGGRLRIESMSPAALEAIDVAGLDEMLALEDVATASVRSALRDTQILRRSAEGARPEAPQPGADDVPPTVILKRPDEIKEPSPPASPSPPPSASPSTPSPDAPGGST